MVAVTHQPSGDLGKVDLHPEPGPHTRLLRAERRETVKVTVIIPAYNAVDSLEATVQALRAQSERDWQGLIVDDGSTDGTAALADRLAAAEPRLRVIHQANGGEAAARNAGLARLATEWVAFLDADDLVDPAWLERLLAKAEADPSLGVVHCAWARVAADDTVVPSAYQAPSGDLFHVWARRSAFPVHAAILRRDVAQRVGTFDTALEKSADWDFWQRIARLGTRFGAIPDVLAYYRMSPAAASLDAAAVLRDGLTVLRRGHSVDPRVPDAAPEHAGGMPPEGVESQVFYLLAWCAGVMLGRGEDPGPLFRQVAEFRFPELYPEGVAECLLDAMPLPACAAPESWEVLWPEHRDAIARFLERLESAAHAPGLARQASAALARQAALRAPSWRDVLAFDEARLNESAARLEESQQAHHAATEALHEAGTRLAAEAARAARTEALLEAELARSVEVQAALLDARDQVTSLSGALRQSEQARQQLLASEEHRAGDFLLNRLRLRRPLAKMTGLVRTAAQGSTMAGLRWDRLRTREPRVLATVCTTFPIYSQTFVHQELASMVEGGHAVRIAYSAEASQADLGGRFEALWHARRRLQPHEPMHRRHLASFRRRMPDRVNALIEAIAQESGIEPADVASHANVLEGFTHARMAEAFGARYLHSYFFYDRSLMTLIASELLGLPRGISCYADHMLRDYELKVVPLHLRRAALVVATSTRIKDELLGIAPDVDPDRILVKPNGIDSRQFPIVARGTPGLDQPFRLVVVCRIEPKKGLVELVEAMGELRDRGVRVQLHLIGAPDEWSPASVRYKERLDQRIGELGLWGTVHLEGKHDHAGILKFLEMSHAFVAPFVETDSGDKDGIPTALLEGMATGLPVVATTAGSIPEVVRDGVEGLLVPQRDPTALADAVATMLSDESARGAMGARAASRVREQFDTATCERLLHARIREVIATHGSSSMHGSTT